jgi:hypothetical protein
MLSMNTDSASRTSPGRRPEIFYRHGYGDTDGADCVMISPSSATALVRASMIHQLRRRHPALQGRTSLCFAEPDGKLPKRISLLERSRRYPQALSVRAGPAPAAGTPLCSANIDDTSSARPADIAVNYRPGPPAVNAARDMASERIKFRP